MNTNPDPTTRTIRLLTAIGAVLLLAGGLAMAQPRHRGPGPGMGHGGPGGHGPHGAAAAHDELRMVGMMMHRLDLSEEQRQQVRETVHRNMQGDFGDLLRAQHRAKRELGIAIHDPDTPAETIVEASRALAAGGEQLALARHALVAELYGLLTEEQQAEYREVMAEHRQRMDERMERRREKAEALGG